MKSLVNKTIKSNKIGIKLFYSKPMTDLEDKVNEWLDTHEYNVISIEFFTPVSENDNKRVMITYEK
jgi:hypothetical protein